MTAHTRSRLLGSFECTQDDATPPITTLHRCSALARVGGLPKRIPKRPGTNKLRRWRHSATANKGLAAADGSALDEGDIAENVSINLSAQNAQRGGKFLQVGENRGFSVEQQQQKKKERTPNVASTHTTTLSKLVCLLPFNFASNSLQFCRKKNQKNKRQD